jgi:hypothetical protein
MDAGFIYSIRKPARRWFEAAVLAGLFLLAGCAQDTAEAIRQKLETLARDDLQFIVKEISLLDTASLALEPRYKIIEYKVLPRSDIYSVKAVVEFYYFRDIKIKQVRKYRYLDKYLQWERYDKQLKVITE